MRRPRPQPAGPIACDRSCCCASTRFRVRLAFCLRVVVPGYTDIALSPQQIRDLNRQYGGIPNEADRHFIVQARALGLGGDA